ncbi:MAG: OmpA family protein, partial [Magnetococcales bacterium]|nr:OmpA family protein [Magnetococcales bacterium]
VATVEKTPVETIVKPPVATVEKTPVETSVKPPVATVEKTPVETSVKPPVAMVEKKPDATFVKLPVITAQQTPVATSIKPPVDTAQQTPVKTSVKPPVSTPQQTPVETVTQHPPEEVRQPPSPTLAKPPEKTVWQTVMGAFFKAPEPKKHPAPAAAPSHPPAASIRQEVTAAETVRPAQPAQQSPYEVVDKTPLAVTRKSISGRPDAQALPTHATTQTTPTRHDPPNASGIGPNREMLGITLCTGIHVQEKTLHSAPAPIGTPLAQLSDCFQQPTPALRNTARHDNAKKFLNLPQTLLVSPPHADPGAPGSNSKLHNPDTDFQITIRFPLGETRLDQGVKALLASIHHYLQRDTQARVLLHGHADRSGPEDFNMLLSHDRAQGVADFLAASGIRPERMEVKGFGSLHPLDPGESETSLARNRRVEIRVLGY